jgi:dual specificity tyrosine-phosphorylation-regulated kinase 2/3/4
MEVKGIPPWSLLAVSSRRKNFFDDNYNPILEPNSRGKTRKPGTKSLKDALASSQDEAFIDFIDKCIEWKVEDRLTPEQAQQHEWIKEGLREISKENKKQEAKAKKKADS